MFVLGLCSQTAACTQCVLLVTEESHALLSAFLLESAVQQAHAIPVRVLASQAEACMQSFFVLLDQLEQRFDVGMCAEPFSYTC
jgi:hypothetical protein